MPARGRGAKAEQDLSERQRYWLGHLRKAEQRGEPLQAYAKRLELSKSSLYEAKRRLRACGLIAPAIPQGSSSPRFARVTVASREASPVTSLRVRLTSGAVLEWREAPQGDALRELIGLVS